MNVLGKAQAEADAEVYAIASGAIAAGKACTVNSDGTVSVITGTSASESTGTPATMGGDSANHSTVYDTANNKTVFVWRNGAVDGQAVVGTLSGTTMSFGTTVVYNAAQSEPCAAAYDVNSGKIVIVYRDGGNSGYGTAIIGTVSGTNISFGTEVVFESASTNLTNVVYHAAAQKVVIAYRDAADGNDGTAIVGTVSGTSISFGSAADFSTTNIGGNIIGVTYDSNNEKVVFTYRDEGNSGYGATIIGTVSGTSISFGTKVIHSSVSTYWNDCCYDSNAQKVLVVYAAGTTPIQLNAAVGTVSGTSISLGTAATIATGDPEGIATVYDSAAKVVTIAHKIYPAGKLTNATISGTSVTFGTTTQFEASSCSHFSAAFDSSANKVALGYHVGGAATYVVHQNAYTSTTLTAENFIGFSDAVYADTQVATIQAAGSVNTGQSGLTAGQQYFVQTTGTIGDSAADPSVVAGTAVSATDLIVKG